MRGSPTPTSTPLVSAKRTFTETPAVPMAECDTVRSLFLIYLEVFDVVTLLSTSKSISHTPTTHSDKNDRTYKLVCDWISLFGRFFQSSVVVLL